MAFYLKEKKNLLEIKKQDDTPIKMAVRLIYRWMYAAKQDKNPYVAILHINYAVGNSILLGEMFPPGIVRSITGVDPYYLHLEASKVQDKIQKKLKLR